MGIFVAQQNVRSRACVRAVKALAICITAFVFACALFGCGEPKTYVFFTRDGITLYVGESRDIAPYMTFEPKICELDNAVGIGVDGDCITVDGTVVTAVKAGVATVRAKIAGSGKSAEMTVEVLSRAEPRMYITTDGEPLQALSDGEAPKPLTFTVGYDGGARASESVAWYVNAADQPSSFGDEFKFEPRGLGEYFVTARSGELSAQQTVRICRITQTSVEYVGKLDQPDGDFSAVRFVAREVINTSNPASRYEWRVNGAVAGSGAVFEFLPSVAGDYAILLTVNGQKQTLFGADSIIVSARGERAPLGSVVFDDEDDVYIKWSDGEHIVRATIISPSGKRRDIERSDAANAYRFERGRFNAEDLIDVFSEAPADYTIVLVAEGRREFKFTQYPEAARSYAENKVFCRNSFIIDETDGENYMTELYATGTERARCYIAGDANKITSAMRNHAGELGMSVFISLDGCVADVELDNIVNAPSKYDTGEAARMYTVMPHIEYDQTARRPSNYAFAVDRIKKSAEVTSSEQLLTAIGYGIRPEPIADSTAAVVYSSARNKLLSVIGADYTDEQKVHAIYDWLQWVTVRADAPSADGCGRFLESVFGSAELLPPSGGLRRAAVTSEGAAKAFALLCRIEGIACVIGSSQAVNGEMRFWNKVNLDGLWYNVDVYGGKILSDEMGLTRAVEQTSHRGLLTDDAYMLEQGLTLQGGQFEAYDISKSVYLNKHCVSGEYFDYYIEQSEKSNEYMYNVAIAAAFSSCVIGSVSVPVTGGIETYVNNTLGAEFRLSDGLTDADVAAVLDSIRAAADNYAKKIYGDVFAENAVRVYRTGTTVGISATAPRQ